MSDLIQYDEWLQLPDDGREHLRQQWNAYEHEMFWVPMLAAARLASRSHVPVSDIYAGIWHGGEYVLHLTVPNSDLSSLPPPLEQTFEGFRVIWVGATQDIQCPRAFIGKWQSSGHLGEFEITVAEDDTGLVVHCVDRNTNTSLQVLSPKVHLSNLYFEACSTDRSYFHILSSDEEINHSISGRQLARRIVERA